MLTTRNLDLSDTPSDEKNGSVPADLNRTAYRTTSDQQNQQVSTPGHSSKKQGKTPAEPRSKSVVTGYEASVSQERYLKDCDRLSMRKLRETYPGTWSCVKNMLYDRTKTAKAIIHPEFNSLKAVLRAIGPRRHDEFTIDRIDTLDPEYAGDKTAWHDKTIQANNRANTLFVVDPRTGELVPLSLIGEELGWNVATLRKRASRGSEDAPQHAPLTLIVCPRMRLPWPMEREKVDRWMETYAQERCLTPWGWEWPFETALRYAEDMEVGFTTKRAALEREMEDWPTPEQDAEWERLDGLARHWAQRVAEARQNLPQWAQDIQGRKRHDPPRNGWETLEDHGPDKVKVRHEQTHRANLHRALTPPQRPVEAKVHRASTVNLRQNHAERLTAQARAVAQPLPTYSAADIVPEPVPIHEDGFPVDDDFRQFREWGKRLHAAMQQADAAPPPRHAPVAPASRRQRAAMR